MKQLITGIFLCIAVNVHSQSSGKIFTVDIDNFWIAYDSIQTTDDFSEKLALINELYISKGTPGLKAFMKARNYNDTLYVKLIDAAPRFWNSIRPNTMEIKNKTVEINKAISRLREIYPNLKDAEMYFTIGGLMSGGTTGENMVLVGAEIATGTPHTDVSEFADDWLKNVFARQSLDNIVSLNIHEYVHTQQKGFKKRVLNHSLREGACDFITELALEQPLESSYVIYGEANAKEVKEQFRKEMYTDDFSNWLYNGPVKGEAADLGYYMGYKICKAYYENAKDKSLAVKEIIELNYGDDAAVEEFLARSHFYRELAK